MALANVTSPRQMLIFSSLLAVLLLLLVLLFAFGGQGTANYKPIQLVSGEWPPYTSANLPEQGVVTAIVTHVLRNMGYQPHYQFMPWSSAEDIAARDEKAGGIRGTFPFINPRLCERIDKDRKQRFCAKVGNGETDNELTEQSSLRDNRFYFTESLLEIDQAVFYSRKHNRRGGQIVQARDLSDHPLIAISGYQYPPHLRKLLSFSEFTVNNIEEALQLLATTPQPLIVIESKQVGQQLLEQKFPMYLSQINTAPLTMPQPVHLMLAKSNAENLALKRAFDKELKALRDDQAGFAALINRVTTRIELSNGLLLQPTDEGQQILAYTDNSRQQQVMLPRGTLVKVITWPESYLLPHSPASEPGVAMARIKVLNGPLAASGSQLYVAPWQLHLRPPVSGP